MELADALVPLPYWLAMTTIRPGWALCEAGEIECGEAEACFHRSIAVAREQNAKMWELRAAMSLAQLWRDQGQRAETRDLLASV